MVFSIPRLSALPVALLLPSVGLLLAYLYVLSQRPEIPDYLTVSDRESCFRSLANHMILRLSCSIRISKLVRSVRLAI